MPMTDSPFSQYIERTANGQTVVTLVHADRRHLGG